MNNLISAETVDEITGNDNGADLISHNFTNAVRYVNAATGGAICEQTVGSVACRVEDDGITVSLPCWFSEVSSLCDKSGKNVQFRFNPDVYDTKPSGEESPRYGNRITLDAEMPTESILTASGTYGFGALPSGLAKLVTDMMAAMGGDTGEGESLGEQADTVMESQSETVNKWSLYQGMQGFTKMTSTDKLPKYPYRLTNDEIGEHRNAGRI